MIKETQRRSRITGFWYTVPHPRWVSILHTIAYAAFALAGVVVLVDPPTFLYVGFGGFLTVYWAWLLIFAGVVGTYSVLPGLYIVERFALIAALIGVAMYGVGLAGLAYVVDTPIFYQEILNGILFILLLVRLVRIWRGVRDPERYSSYTRPDGRRRYTA